MLLWTWVPIVIAYVDVPIVVQWANKEFVDVA
jgi:hypothetical protein